MLLSAAVWRVEAAERLYDHESEITEHRLNEEQKKRLSCKLFQSLHIVIRFHRHKNVDYE